MMPIFQPSIHVINEAGDIIHNTRQDETGMRDGPRQCQTQKAHEQTDSMATSNSRRCSPRGLP